MAKKKGKRSRSRRNPFKKSKSGRRRGKTAAVATQLAGALGAIGYGFMREKVSVGVSQYTQWIPGGGITDEIAMFGVSWAAEKFGGRIPVVGGVIKQAGKAGQLIELARVGQAFATGGVGLGALGGGNGTPAGTASFR